MHEIPNFISHEECDEIIKLIDANHTRSSVVVGGTDRSDVTDHRTSSTSNLDPNLETVKEIHSKISQYLNLPLEKGESLQGQLYEPGQYFKPHNDFFTGPAYNMHCRASGNRTHTLMIYLNDDFEGGETNFPTLKKSVVAEKGKALWWKNMHEGATVSETLHEGVAVKSGKKYIVTSWWRENKWDGAGDMKKYEEYKNLQPVPYESAVVQKPEPVLESKIIKVSKPKVNSEGPLPRLTENGFSLTKCPDKLWSIIKDCYNLLKEKESVEQFSGKEEYVPGDTKLLSFDHLPSIKNLLHEELKEMHEDFCGKELIPTFVYGIRSYEKGSSLKEHVDRAETHHISSIIIVDKDLTCGCQNKKYADDWPLDIKGHDGEWYKVYTQPGDMILYESAVCEHARKELFGGNYFRNFYVHYKFA
tara:strand:+ start:1193 stop:2443 length:1251 start_codon:yes stop_codon:yes gene_type:complete